MVTTLGVGDTVSIFLGNDIEYDFQDFVPITILFEYYTRVAHFMSNEGNVEIYSYEINKISKFQASNNMFFPN